MNGQLFHDLKERVIQSRQDTENRIKIDRDSPHQHPISRRTYRFESSLKYDSCHFIDVLELLRPWNGLRTVYEQRLQRQGLWDKTETRIVVLRNKETVR